MKKVTRRISVSTLLVVASTVSAATEYEIEISHDDSLFVINGEKYEAMTYCFSMEEGDRVIFLDGNPYGACASAKIINLRTEDVCDVWCE